MSRPFFFALAFLCSSSVSATAEDFYKDKLIRIVVGGSVGGGYDSHARLIANYLTKHIPGDPSIVVQNMPAANGLVATNHLYNVAKADGTEIGVFNRNTLFAPVMGQEQAKFKIENFSWLGTPASYSDNAFLLVIRSALPHRTFDDLRKADPPLNVPRLGSVVIRVLSEALGAKIKFIGGYTGNEQILALERGEIDGQGESYANIASRRPEWLSKGIVRVMVQFGNGTRLPQLPDVPTAQELAQTPDDLALVKFAELPLTIGYPFAAPPGVPLDRIAILRNAFQTVMAHPDYRADVLKAKLEYSPKNGGDLQVDIQNMARTPLAVTERYKKMAADGFGG